MSPRPYQSRLFNFLNQHSLQLRDRLGEAVRHLKVAAEWSVQALVYPIFWLVQTGIKTGNQIAAADRLQLPPESASKPSESLCDRPINRIAQTLSPVIENLTPVRKPSPPSSWWSRLIPWQPPSTPSLLPPSTEIVPSLALQGIATLLASRKLVLVTADNQTQDLLSDRQQQKLKACIHRAMVDYHYQYRCLFAPQKKILGLIPQTAANSDRPLPPIDFALQVWRWIQYQPAAIALEQWRDDRLGVTALVPAKSATALEKSQHRRIASHLAQTSQSIIPQAAIQFTPFAALFPAIAAAVDYFFGTTAQTTLPASAESLAAASLLQSPVLARTAIALQHQLQWPELSLTFRNDALGNREPDPFQLHHILQAAVDYFFGEERKHRAIAHSSPSVKLNATPPRTPLPSAAEQTLADPWLMWEDLFPEAIAPTESRTNSAGVATLPSGHPLPPTHHQSVTRPRVSPAQALKKTTKQSKNISQRHSTKSNQGAIAKHSMDDSAGTMDFEPDWIEIVSQPVGYVYHPLEILLNVLDRAIFALEKVLNWLWQGLRWLFPRMRIWLRRIFQTFQQPL